MNDIILLKLGEIVLKGLNRKSFEQKLMSNVRRRLEPIGKFRVYCLQSTVYVEAQEDGADMDAAFEALKKVFGVIKLSRAAACEKDRDAIAALAIEYLREDMERVRSFKVESKRSDKSFPLTSIQLSQYVGGLLAEAYPNVQVDVHEPELTVHLEVRDLAAYVHATPVPGAGGMPVGSNGVAVTLLSGGIDSPVSTYMIAKRGVRLIPVHFFSFPYTSQQAKDKVVELGRQLTEYCGRMTLEVVPFTHIQEEIRDKCPEEYFTLIMRRFMMRIAKRIADANGAKAVVTGENLGQVASQTMEAMASTQAVIDMPVLQPLIGMDKEEIVTLARKIGTFETSILPYEDCCTVFTPRHPRTHPKLKDVEAAESALDIAALVDEAVKGIERIRLDHE
ncbi:MAG: tRNA uracil 4-sulfurtransferase ThiI [Candidatus Limivicinus sp.]|nr:tRNA 4-thiouridine(8) synthase ThiI [Clostridiales bacterium]MDY6132730.1 tRNA uracil 4-sulfurtransferase ThiI [Candidatus Limivicinus sp.]